MLALFFRFTKLGLAMRAGALNPAAARLLGVRTSILLALGWGFAAVLGAVSGMMVAPTFFLTPNMMQAVLIYAFAAAVLGGLESPVGAVVGGIALGVILQMLDAVRGLRDARPAAADGARRAARRPARAAGRAARPPGRETRMTGAARRLARARLRGARRRRARDAVADRELPEYQLGLVAVYLIALLGLNILTGFTGQISLGHGAFMGIGAYTTTILVVDHGWRDSGRFRSPASSPGRSGSHSG